ncbi:hypothetical protein [Vibrio parahaemolyticus]|uniref:hypothetical protein n=1 Tax=Vibrio parahaemolyticus TaxID=670 RepID=UPI0027E54B09|nr:hypothetical protein [Vibrio parahaemolyticus]WMN84113.1 hypothetical protein NI384_06335 [Vibrio parahaemolyticus]
MERCGKCKQFTRTKENNKDLCGAWEQPTTADRQACQFTFRRILAFFKTKKVQNCSKPNAKA